MANPSNPESETWQPARLIPTSGISGADEQERRATSALLAVMTAVRDFGLSIVTPLGCPKANLETYTEVPFKLDGRTVIPDGLIRAQRGSRSWTCLVEVKTGSAELRKEQVEAYLDVARAQGFDCVITISNALRAPDGSHPLQVDGRKTKAVALHHLSWSALLTAAIYQNRHIGISDPDQAWILDELIRYLEHDKSGAREFDDMGPDWVAVREAVANRVLKPRDPGTLDVCARWGQFTRYLCLVMTRRLGVDVIGGMHGKRPRAAFDLQATAADLAATGCLRATFGVPDTAGPIDVTADLNANRLEIAIRLDAPREGRSSSRITWLLRQLKEAAPGTRIDIWLKAARQPHSVLLSELREDPSLGVPPAGKEIASFVVAGTYKLGSKRAPARAAKPAGTRSFGAGAAFVPGTVGAFEDFYDHVVAHLRAWQAPAPKAKPADDRAGGMKQPEHEATAPPAPPQHAAPAPGHSGSFGTWTRRPAPEATPLSNPWLS